MLDSEKIHHLRFLCLKPQCFNLFVYEIYVLIFSKSLKSMLIKTPNLENWREIATELTWKITGN